VFQKNVPKKVKRARMNALDTWSLAVSSINLAIPISFALVGLLAPRYAEKVCGLALAFALVVSTFLASGGVLRQGSTIGVRLDLVTCVMLLLVCGIGLVIGRYSRTYMDGDPRIASYFRWLLLTLSAVTSLVVANNLFVIAAAWTATSLSLHQLLVFYPERPAALVAAHKKFLASRLADVCFWSCLVLVQTSVGSLDLDRIGSWANAHPELSLSMNVAAILAVLTVALKSAQLPFHGWLTQVMEAPTPVSALLHAGIVNIGGFVMIRLAPWMAHAKAAQLLLIAIGLFTTIVAALVMTTRVSVKVALAWSTCAQMGFMLVQCGLGAWHLALLHLVAHSLYKAHAFLSAGGVVEGWRVQEMRKPSPRPTSLRFGGATLVALTGAAASVLLLQHFDAVPHGANVQVWVLAILVALSVVPMIVGRSAGALSTIMYAASALGVALLYAAGHIAAAYALPDVESVSASTSLGWAFVGAGVVMLFALKASLMLHPQGALARGLYPWLFAGFYLDERFTRLTFWIWPPRLQRSETSPVIPMIDTVEVGR